MGAATIALLSSQLVGTTATILMPEDAPTVKVQAVYGYGAEVVMYDRYTKNREAIVHARKCEVANLRVGVVISGGNVGIQRFCQLLGDSKSF